MSPVESAKADNPASRDVAERRSRVILLFTLLAFILLPFASLASAASVTLAWDANSEPDVAGYKIYYGTSSGNYPVSIDAGGATEYTVSSLQAGTKYYFAATAYDYNGNESGFSEEVDHTVAVPNQPPIAAAGPDQTIEETKQVTLNGGNSADPGGSIASYFWEQTAGPPVTLSHPDAASTTFSAPYVSFSGQTLRFTLTVTDNGGLQDVDDCSILVIKDAVSDADGDGVPDDQDALPDNSGEWADNDQDGIGDNADTDDDNDGMPDTWEILNQLDPLKNDAAGDADGDGIDNQSEYQAGTDPKNAKANAAPDAPVVNSPFDNALVSLTPTLETDDYYDEDLDDFHAGTQWKIYRASDDLCVLDTTCEPFLTAFKVPKLILDEDSTYYWKARFIDNHGKASEWSAVSRFVTEVNQQDKDGNGVPDHQELTDDQSDMDFDGNPDSKQEDIRCIYVDGNKSRLGLTYKGSDTVVAIESLEAADPDDPEVFPPSTDKPSLLPFDVINFKLKVKNPGDTAIVKVFLSDKPPLNARWYKYNRISGRWQDYSEHAEFNEDRTAVTLTLQDGGECDEDGLANGIIIDPAGVGVPPGEKAQSDSNDDILGVDVPEASCFIDAAGPGDEAAEFKLWREIRGREPAIVFTLLLLVLTGKIAAQKIRQRHRWRRLS